MVVESLESSCEVSKRKHGDGGDGIRILLDEFSNGDVNSVSSVSSKRAKVSREMTFQEDSDWEPMQQTKPVESVKWFCVNCTMPNPGDMVHCYMCGEHKESGILSHGCFASPFCKDNGLTQVEEKRGGSSPSTSSTAVGFDERMWLHSEVCFLKELPHVERPDRLPAIAASLATAGVFPGRCFPIHAREITKQELQMVHTSEHVDAVDTTSQLQHSYFTSDTYANEYSARAARLAAGLCADLAKEIFSGRVKNGFALVRPPGHHAGIKDAMGFCLHNNAAVAALVAQAAGARKVLIVDWDVHHGNGTQEIFEKNKSVMYISLHRHEGGKFYPGTGAANERHMREAVVTQGAVDAEAVVVDEAPPSEFAFNFSYSGDGSLLDDKEACGELFRLFRLEPDPSRDLSPPDETNLYNEYALSVARSIASVNAMVAEYENALRTARADLEEQKKELEEMASLRRELEEERKSA
ncbi:hypothetical protein YC2023_039064 [Brassica napus]